MVVTLRQPDGASRELNIADPGPILKIDDGQKLARAPWSASWIVYGRPGERPVEANMVVTIRAAAADVPAKMKMLADEFSTADEIVIESDDGEPLLSRPLLGASFVGARSPSGVAAGQISVSATLRPGIYAAGYILDESGVVVTDEDGVELEYREAI